MLIYLIRNKINGKGYVGQTTTSLEQRRASHEYESRVGSQWAIHCALRKYGADNFEFSILVETDNLSDLNRLEIEEIEKQGTLSPNGYNMVPGGNHPPIGANKGRKLNLSLEQRAEMAERTKNQMLKLWTEPEFIAKMEARPAYSPESNAKRSAAVKGRKISLEEMAKRIGRKHSLETRAKMSASAMGHTRMKGKKKRPLSPEHKAKISSTKKSQHLPGVYYPRKAVK